MEPGALTLRVNLGEQCQLECGYCRPGLLRRPTRGEDRLTPAEYARLGPLFSKVGVDKLRFTGGEPLLRGDLLEVLAAFRGAMPRARLALTTNGLRLGSFFEAGGAELVQAVTVHVDSLDPARYRRSMGDGDVGVALANAREAKARGLVTKLNVVVQRGLNDDELHDFLAWSRAARIEVRFIELMNTGSACDFTRRHFVTGEDVIARLGRAEPVLPAGRREPTDPARLFRLRDGTTFGLIASDTQPFCGACTRLRLSPSGELRTCLYQPAGLPLGQHLRQGASDVTLVKLIDLAVATKRSHHPAQPEPRSPFSMADVGG